MSRTITTTMQWFELRLGLRLYSEAHHFGGEVISISQSENEPLEIVLHDHATDEHLLVPVTAESQLRRWH